MTSSESLDFYLKNHGLFLADFWAEGNRDLRIAIDQRDDVESGIWYTATWTTKANEERYITSQRYKLLWERIIKRYLKDEKREVAPFILSKH